HRPHGRRRPGHPADDARGYGAPV
ncbi:MAG: hypothetical protein AVDCRST_MAG33-1188, partial [uncultured Thermomicrobiales bacterium]